MPPLDVPTSALLLLLLLLLLLPLHYGPRGVLHGLLDGVADFPTAIGDYILSAARASTVESLELLLVSLLIRIDSTWPTFP